MANAVVHLDISGAALEFAAGHFTVLSATERETIHGHNYQVTATLSAAVTANGMIGDYRYYRNILAAAIAPLRQKFLLPTKSPYLTLQEDGKLLQVHFNGETIPFLRSDVVILPIVNITIEALAGWLLEQVVTELAKTSETSETPAALAVIRGFKIRVANGSGCSAMMEWSASAT